MTLNHPAACLSACFLAAAWAASVVGCSKQPTGPPRYETRGAVTFRGQPVSDAQVAFFSPRLGISRGAVTNDQGQFRVIAASGHGLPAGEYSVVVRPAPRGDEERINYNRPDIPKHYRSKRTSNLTATISETENEVALELGSAQ